MTAARFLMFETIKDKLCFGITEDGACVVFTVKDPRDAVKMVINGIFTEVKVEIVAGQASRN